MEKTEKTLYGLAAVVTCCFFYALGVRNGNDDCVVTDPHFVASLKTTLDESRLYALAVADHDLPSLKKERDVVRERVNVAKNYAAPKDVQTLLNMDETIEQKENALTEGEEARLYLESLLATTASRSS